MRGLVAILALIIGGIVIAGLIWVYVRMGASLSSKRKENDRLKLQVEVYETAMKELEEYGHLDSAVRSRIELARYHAEQAAAGKKNEIYY